MEFLTASTKALLGGAKTPISAAGKNVVVIGGGDTGTDCVGTAIRQGAKSVVQLEILPRPPETRAADNPWPQWPKIYKLDYGQEEAAALWGADPRRYLVNTRRLIGDAKGHVKAIETFEIDWVHAPGGRPQPVEREGTEQTLDRRTWSCWRWASSGRRRSFRPPSAASWTAAATSPATPTT